MEAIGDLGLVVEELSGVERANAETVVVVAAGRVWGAEREVRWRRWWWWRGEREALVVGRGEEGGGGGGGRVERGEGEHG